MRGKKVWQTETGQKEKRGKILKANFLCLQIFGSEEIGAGEAAEADPDP